MTEEFDLDVKRLLTEGGADKKISKEDKLKGYRLLEKDKWYDLPTGTHIRYEKGGQFRTGGFIQNKYIGKDHAKHFFLQTGFDPRAPGYLKWGINLDEIDKIWIKESLAIGAPIAASFENTLNMEIKLQKLEDRLDVLEANLSKILDFLKRRFATTSADTRVQRNL